jgi:acyl-CoA synthetase (AMP-forming)/AMP-acid ligase II
MQGIKSIHDTIIENIKHAVTIHRDFLPSNSSHPTSGCSPIVNQDPALALFTSGSTGVAKGVMISHQDLYNRVLTECHDYEITATDCLLSLLPFSFDVGCNQLFTSLLTGAQLVILNSWLPGDILYVIRNYRVTGISAVPAIWTGILESEDQEMRQVLNTVRYLTVSGGDLAPAQLQKLAVLAKNVGIYKTYGQTETFRSSILRPDEFQDKMLSVGKPVKGTEVFVLNSKGHKAAPHEIGQVIHRGDGMMQGYIGDRHGTRKKLRKNPLKRQFPSNAQKVVFTGDIGKMDEEGYLYLLGRKDRMIKTSGFRFYPKEVVDHILAHEAVKDAVVFAVKDDKIGYSVFCEVQLNDPDTLSENDIKVFLSDRVPSYMIPAKVIFVTSFPRTPTGKIKLAEVEKKYYG